MTVVLKGKEDLDQEIIEQLRASKEAIGVVEKVTLDADGNLVDGHHRIAADPNWPTEINPKLKTEEDCILFMIAKNWHRTTKNENWKHGMIARLAKLGNDVSAIAKKTGFKERTIYYYMPSDLKKPEPLQLASARLALNRESQETEKPRAIQCAGCAEGSYYAKPYKVQGKEYPLCPRCLKLAETSQPETFFRTHIQPRLPQEERGIPEPLIKPSDFKLKPSDFDSYAEKDAHRKVQHSQEEMDLTTELSSLGLTPTIDKPICLWSTIPDGQYESKKLAYYVHGKPHGKGKALERDDEILAALQRQHWTVLVFRHGEGTPKEWARQVQEALRF